MVEAACWVVDGVVEVGRLGPWVVDRVRLGNGQHNSGWVLSRPVVLFEQESRRL